MRHLGRDWPAAALALAACILIVPLWCVHSPAMPDYPAHIAGFGLIAAGGQAAPLSTFYDVHWMLVPNLASEIIVPALAQVMGLETAAKLFLSVAVAMWVLGPAAIQRALLGKTDAAPLAGAFFAYNANFTWGFFNYYFAAGLCFVMFAAWIATARRRNFATLAGFALAVLALYICHLVAVFIFLAMIGCFEISQLWAEKTFDLKTAVRRASSIALVFSPAAVAFLFFKPAGMASGELAFDFADTIGDRFGAAIQSYFSEPAYLLTGALAILILAGLLYGKLRVHPAMKILVIALAGLTLVAPEWALGGWGVHLRLPGVLGAVLFASIELDFGRRLQYAAAGLLLLALAWNASVLEQDWRAYDLQYGEFRAALRDIPERSKLVTVLDADAMDTQTDQPYWHMAEFAILDRGGFTPLMFATKGQHIVQLKPPFGAIAAASAQQGSPPDVSELDDLAAGQSKDDTDIDEVFPYLKFFQCHFDEAVVIHGEGEPSPVPKFLTLRHAGSFFSLYDIHPTSICAKR